MNPIALLTLFLFLWIPEIHASICGRTPAVQKAIIEELRRVSTNSTWQFKRFRLHCDEVTEDHLLKVKELHLSNKKLGPSLIKEDFALLPNLEVLDVSYNELQGPIPEFLREFEHLKWLGLDNNQFTGGIARALSNLLSLEWLDISNNKFSGPIPSVLGRLYRLEILDLSHNQFDGPIPNYLGNLTRLKRLYLDHNQLVGPVPEILGNFPLMERLYLSHNHLTGPFPRPWAICPI